MEAEQFLQRSPDKFDIVFLDPPFSAEVLPALCEALERRHLNEDAYIYIEASAQAGAPPLPSNWRLMRSKQAGQVGYHLAQRTAGAQG